MANPVLPPVAGTAHHVIHGGTTPPTPADVGIASTVAGCVITDLKTSFPLTHDVYHDQWMQPLADILHGLGFEMSFNVETHLRGTSASAADIGIPTVAIGSLVSEELVAILGVNDTRGWATGTGTAPATLWPNGTRFIVGDGAGTFERQKLRKDALTLQWRRYSTTP
jgi:hypothetical protein